MTDTDPLAALNDAVEKFLYDLGGAEEPSVVNARRARLYDIASIAAGVTAPAQPCPYVHSCVCGDLPHSPSCYQSAGVTARPCDRPHRRIAHLPPGIPTCPICMYRNPGAKPGDTRPVGEHDCEAER